MSKPTDQTNAHYAAIFSRFKSDLGGGSVSLETQCLAYELSQVSGVPSSGRVLDAGCGTGRYAAAWREIFPSSKVIGVDINATILTTGQVSPYALVPVNGNLENLPFKSASFDVVMSRGAIQHTSNPRQALRELLRVCRPGGLLYFYTYRHGLYDVVLGVFRRVAKTLGTYFCSRVIYALCRLLRLDPRVAAMILDELFVPIRFAFSPQTILDWLHSSGVPLASVQPVRHAQFGDLDLPVDWRTKWIYRIAPKIGLITLAVHTAEAKSSPSTAA
jgi:SAM-dependent methyltransferase